MLTVKRNFCFCFFRPAGAHYPVNAKRQRSLSCTCRTQSKPPDEIAVSSGLKIWPWHTSWQGGAWATPRPRPRLRPKSRRLDQAQAQALPLGQAQALAQAHAQAHAQAQAQAQALALALVEAQALVTGPSRGPGPSLSPGRGPGHWPQPQPKATPNNSKCSNTHSKRQYAPPCATVCATRLTVSASMRPSC